MTLQPLVAIVGPTSVGKSALAIEVASEVGGEVVSADSRQVYVGMDIGTAKPTPAERELVRHHLIDILTPDQTLTLADYQSRAYRAIETISASGHIPLLVGGTGQYVKAVLEGWVIPQVPPDMDIREDLENFSQTHGAMALHSRLAAVDPDAARAIDGRNIRRVIRALEVYLATGEPISRLQQRQPPNYRIAQIGLTRPRSALFASIDERVDLMIAGGLVEEVRGLLRDGYDGQLPAFSGLGYAEIISYLQGTTTLEQAVESVKRNTRRFVRKQYNWFQLSDPSIRWFDLSDSSPGDIPAQITKLVSGG